MKSFSKITGTMKWILLTWFLFFLMCCKLSTGQSKSFTNKAWIGFGWNTAQNTEMQSGFVVYYFNKNGILETNDTTINYSWKYVNVSNKVRLKNLKNNEVFTYKIVKCSKDSMILRNKDFNYFFLSLNPSIISLTKDSLYSLLHSGLLINSLDTTKKMKLNEDKSIYLLGPNEYIEARNELTWHLEFFRGCYFLLITPGVISYQIILLEDKLLLNSINANNNTDLYMNLHKD